MDAFIVQRAHGQRRAPRESPALGPARSYAYGFSAPRNASAVRLPRASSHSPAPADGLCSFAEKGPEDIKRSHEKPE